MRVASARLKKRITDDGLMEIWEDVNLGKEYLVDLDSIKVMHGRNLKHRLNWQREMVIEVMSGRWLPTELLTIEGRETA